MNSTTPDSATAADAEFLRDQPHAIVERDGVRYTLLGTAHVSPKEIVARLNAEMVKIIHSPDFAQRMQAIGAEPLGGTQEEMARQIREETAKFAKLVKEGGVAIE